MAAELVETTRLYARTLARHPARVGGVGGRSSGTRNYSEPTGERARAGRRLRKRVLFGVTLIARRKVNYGPIEPGNFAGDFIVRRWWMAISIPGRRSGGTTRELIEYLEELEHKSRRRDLLVDEQVIYEYYDKRIPEGSTARRNLKSGCAGRRTPKQLLHMRLQDLTRETDDAAPDREYPDELEIGGMRLPLVYHFDPAMRRTGG